MRTDRENAVRWTPGERRGHVESHFLRACSPDGRRAVWIKHTLLQPSGGAGREPAAEVWAIAFERGTAGFPRGGKVSVPIGEARFRASPFRTEAAGSVLAIPPKQGTADGALTTGDGEAMRWSLRFAPVGPPFRPYPAEALYRAPLPRTKVITPCPDARFEGEVSVGDTTWRLDGWTGMQGHNWGSQHSEPYVWCHVNAWDGGTHDGVWLEAMASKVGAGPVRSPWLAVGAIHVDGETLRFDTPGAVLRPRVQLDTRRWIFELRRRGATLEGELEARGEDMAGLRYENPDGSAIACLNSKLATGRIRLQRTGRPDVVLESERVALEIGTAASDHGVRMIAPD